MSGWRRAGLVREYVVVFLIAAVTSYLLCVVARELASRTGAVARIRDRDVHQVPIPYFGGLAMLGGLAAGLLVARHLPFLGGAPEVTRHDTDVVLIAGAIICAVGVIDDLIELDAITKLGGQVIAAGYMVVSGVQFYGLSMAGGSQFVLDTSQAILVTVLLVVGTVNAVNFVDGLDGLASGVVLIGAIAFFLFSYRLADVNGETLAITAAMLCAAMGGACLGFLPHNFFPARIFMGDSGSMLLGLVLSGSALTLTGQFAGIQMQPGAEVGSPSSWPTLLIPILLPISILLIPLLDLVLAIVRRTRRGQAFYQPDKEHLHHRLLQIGHSQRRAVLIIWMWAGLVAFGAVLISLYGGNLTWLVIALGTALCVATTWYLPRMKRPLDTSGDLEPH